MTLRRRALVRTTAVATALLAGSVIPGTTVAVAAHPGPEGTGTIVRYRVRKLTTVAGAVRVVERSPLDPFLYVVSRNGRIVRISRDGTTRRKVLDISSMTTADGERGLLGLAFRRSGASWEAFVNYTDPGGDTVVARWRVRPDGSFVRQPGAIASVVIRIAQPYANHNGGDLQVGPDNMLYIGTGDGGSGGDPERRAMDLKSLLGKILRIDPDHVVDGRGHAYRIPKGNPFVGRGRGEIWSIGLRNPWRFTFDRSRNLWIADVGQNKYEEVSRATASSAYPGGRGANFGWSAFEGLHPYNSNVPTAGVTKPVHEYDHENSRCSISGAAVATSLNLPGRAGWFLYGDFCSGKLVAFRTDGVSTTHHEIVAGDAGNITSVNSTSLAILYTTLDGTVGIISTK